MPFALPVPLVRWLLAVFCLAIVQHPACVRAQNGQEKIIQQRLERAGTLEYTPADKSFASTANVGIRQAAVRPFAFGRAANLKSGDGTFHTRDFADRGKFRTGDYATRADRASTDNSFAAADRGFAVKALPVQEAAAAHKAAPIRPYLPAEKSIVVKGKRQDDLDDLYHQKNLSIDQVREILNKPGSGMDAPGQTMGSPVRRALPVNAPAAQ